MIKTIIKAMFIAGAVVAITGCKVALMVPSGGDVTSASGTRNCTGGSLCEFNVTDYSFNESFTAVARPGYVFTKWSPGPGFLCPNSVNPTCGVSNTGTTQGITVIDDFIAGGSFFYAMPKFEFVGIDTDGDGIKDHLDADDDNDGVLDVDDNCPLAGPNADGFGCPSLPITDTVIANGKEWAQVGLFTNLSWNDINAVCPAGVCAGMLKGYDMTGWTWASLGDVDSLFMAFGVPLSILSQENVHEIDSTWAPLIMSAFRPTESVDDVFRQVGGWSRDLKWDDSYYAYIPRILEYNTSPPITDMAIRSYHPKDDDVWYGGGWFYREQPE